jgi:uncharacterized protein (DUF934 family)
MRRLLRQREVVEDGWRYLGDESPGAGDSVIVPLAELRDNAEVWRAWSGKLGVRVGPAARIEELAAELPRLALVAIEFPGPAEGRGYTLARLLRDRYRFSGEIRAVGVVKRDQIFFMSRCGFDAFELSAGEDFEGALESLGTFTYAYQPRGALTS